MSTLAVVDKHHVSVTIEVDAATFEKGMTHSYNKNVKKITLPGFRKGKAPRKLVEMQYGESFFYEDAFEYVFPKAYEDAVKEHKLEPVAQPEIEIGDIGKGKPMTFTATVTIKPEVTLGQYTGIEVTRVAYPVTDEDVDAELTRAQQRLARWEDITDRPVQNEDRITLDYAGSVDGVSFDGGTAENQTLEIGSGRFIPGFEEQLVGMAINEERDINITFPDEYHAEELAGKAAVFHVKVLTIQGKDLPPLDDELAKDLSEFDTLDEYKADIRKNLEQSAETRAKTEMDNQMLEKIALNAEVDIPDVMIQQQVDMLLREFSYRLMYQGLNIEQYMQYTGQTAEDLRGQYAQTAEEQVRMQLVMEAIVRKEKLPVTEEEIDKEIEQTAQRRRVEKDTLLKDMTPEDKETFADMARLDKITDWLRESVVLVDAPSTIDAPPVVDAPVTVDAEIVTDAAE